MSSTKTNNKKIIVSAIQPSNRLTLGNYLGAILPYVNYQKKYKMYIFIADLHVITANFEPKSLLTNRKQILALYKACGLDFKKNIIFYQSDIMAHNNLAHVLLCHTTLGELTRMTQFKDKSVKNANNTTSIPSGLLTYPTLMAADILLYDPDAVIVGKDQKQHLELTRDIAIRMNKKYGNIFTTPEMINEGQSVKIMDLVDPSIKMSKSNNNEAGIIYLLDQPAIAASKIMKAKTDNLNQVKYDVINQPGISNLINIYAAITNLSIKAIEKKYAKIKNYGEFKNDVAAVIKNLLIRIQANYKQANKCFDQLVEITKKNAIKCNKIANKKLADVYQKIGLKD